MSDPRPVIQVLLKDGHSAVIRESMSSIKHCKRNNLTMSMIVEGKKAEIPARIIQSVLMRSGE